jgi:hypothetical protein
VINKIYKNEKVKTNLRILGLDKLDYINFEDDQKSVDAKKELKENRKLHKKSNKRSNLASFNSYMCFAYVVIKCNTRTM